MDEETKEYQEKLKADGVDIPLEEEEKVEEATEEPTKPEEKLEKEDPKEEPTKDLSDQKEFKKRSIYDEYKDKKSELKSEKELREKADGEIADLKTKLEAFQTADTKEDKKEALDDIDAFAKEIGADPETIRKMQKLFSKGTKPSTDESLQKDLKEFKDWKAQNQQAVEKQTFESEYTGILPQLKKDFPTASDEEMTAVKSKIDELSHSKDFHDKTLDYVIFKNKADLSALVSPKKRGMETKERNEVIDDNFEFDANADITKLTAKHLEQWEKKYKQIMESEQIMDNGQGGKIII